MIEVIESLQRYSSWIDEVANELIVQNVSVYWYVHLLVYTKSIES